jgi:hypothetical protein
MSGEQKITNPKLGKKATTAGLEPAAFALGGQRSTIEPRSHRYFTIGR